MTKSKQSAPRPAITLAKGFAAAGGAFGIKPSGKPDVALIVADRPCAAAAVFTTNQVPGAPIIVGKRHVKNGKLRAIVVNAGVSNVWTGDQGIQNAISMCQTTARALGCEPSEVLPSSTGVIGVPLPIDKILKGIQTLAPTCSVQGGADAAEAILTTDLVTKQAFKRIKLAGQTVTLGGVAKGSGMIAPNMATMLAYITTDASIRPAVLRKALKQAVAVSFNRISVDMDTSTSDTLAVLASGAVGHPELRQAEGDDYEKFVAALTKVCQDLAYQVIQDGEGVERVIRVKVKGAASRADADRVGRTIVNSPLVKTAVHGGDPNVGRLAMAIGRSGAKLDLNHLTVKIGSQTIGKAGQAAKRTPELEAKLAKAMAGQEVVFTVDLGLGKHNAEWLGCDLSREYIHINADYTT